MLMFTSLVHARKITLLRPDAARVGVKYALTKHPQPSGNILTVLLAACRAGSWKRVQEVVDVAGGAAILT